MELAIVWKCVLKWGCEYTCIEVLRCVATVEYFVYYLWSCRCQNLLRRRAFLLRSLLALLLLLLFIMSSVNVSLNFNISSHSIFVRVVDISPHLSLSLSLSSSLCFLSLSHWLAHSQKFHWRISCFIFYCQWFILLNW